MYKHLLVFEVKVLLNETRLLKISTNLGKLNNLNIAGIMTTMTKRIPTVI